MHDLRDLLGLGLESKDLGVLQVCLRAVIVFLATLAVLRTGHRRFMSRMTAFDAVLGVLLASILARAVNGSAPLVPTLAAALVTVLLHRLLSVMSFYWKTFGRLVKGEPDILIEDGKTNTKRMRAHKISEHDLLEEARLNGKVTELSRVRKGVLERNGKISIIPIEE